MAARYCPLSQLLYKDRQTTVPVAAVAGQFFSWLHFTHHVTALAEQIKEMGVGRWLLHTENTYHFAVGLFGLWQSDSVAVLPPNTGKQTLKELGEETQGLISDHLASAGELSVLAPLTAPTAPEQSFSTLDRDAFKLELYTSGSTGQRRVLKKTLANLEDELEGLEMLWGGMLGESEIFGTVSHQHIYGLLFRVLWPLSSNRVIRAETYLSPSRLLDELRLAQQACLVSVPAHLKRIPELIDFAELGSHCKVIFSAGGPLSTETSHTFTQNAQLTPFELFGSTETGGIAWRQQTTGIEAIWKPFRNVELRAKPPEGFLQVRSPFLGESDPDGWFTTGDLVEILPFGGFLHRGRGDRVVKIEEKRLSLPDMEAKLETHPWVESAIIFFKEPPPFLQRRPPLSTVVVLNKRGGDEQAQNGDRKLIRKLKQFLSEAFDPVLFPRSWKFVDDIPTDPQGKVTVEILRSLLDSSDLEQNPQILEKKKVEEVGETELFLKLHIPHNLIFCDGHFEGYPVVPGVIQVHWAAGCIGELLTPLYTLKAVEALKFHKPLIPGQNCLLELQHTPGTQKITFRIHAEQLKTTSGRFVISPYPSSG